MFKKKPQIKPAAPLRSSDRRKLADAIIRDHGLQTETPEGSTEEQKQEATAAKTALRNSLLPDNVQTAKFSMTHGPQLKQINGIIYLGTYQGDDIRILWWQIEGHMYPSIYTIWKHPDLLVLLFTPSIVVEKIKGGADLMTPGLAGGPPFPSRARKGAIVAVSAAEQPATPVAVGICEIDVSALQQVRGAKGIAVESLHWTGDELYNFSPSGRPPPQVPDKIDGWEQFLIEQETFGKVGDLALDDDEGGVPAAVAANQTGEQPSIDLNNTEVSDQPLTVEEIDAAFKKAFLYSLYDQKSSHPKEKNFGLVFPLNQSYIMSHLIQPYLPIFTPEQGQQLQIKKTSWKNIKKFVKALDKERIVKSKEMGGHETVILDIDFDDAAIASFKPYQLPKKESSSATVPQGTQADGADDALGQKLEVKNFFKPTALMSPLFLKADRHFFSAAEAKEAVTQYVQSENLVSERNKRMIELNPTLANAVFDGSGSLDKEVLAKGSVPREALIDRVLKSMAPSYVILRNGADMDSAKPRSGAAPKISVTLETRSGNKTVTKVSGLEVYHIRPKPLADELRKTCAGSTSIEPLAGATKKNEKPIEEITIQGPQHEAVLKALEKRGVSARWVEVTDKSKGPKKWKGHTG